MQICFILVEPAVPGNIGASARAIKTMGFNSLRLVRPAEYLGNEARMFAHGAGEILERAEVSLKDYIVLTTLGIEKNKDFNLKESEIDKVKEEIKRTCNSGTM